MGQPETPKVYRLSVYRPSRNGKVPMPEKVAEGTFLFTDDDASVSSAATVKQKIDRLREKLPDDWDIKSTEVPFHVHARRADFRRHLPEQRLREVRQNRSWRLLLSHLWRTARNRDGRRGQVASYPNRKVESRLTRYRLGLFYKIFCNSYKNRATMSPVFILYLILPKFPAGREFP